MRVRISLIAGSILCAMTAQASPATDLDLRGMVDLHCSGSLIDVGRSDNQKAVVATNGHCASRKFLGPSQVLSDTEYNRSNVIVFTAKRIRRAFSSGVRTLYATMYKTDLALLELPVSYAELKSSGSMAYPIAAAYSVGESVKIVSGFWQETLQCSLQAIVHELHQNDWIFTKSLALSQGCESTRGGFSGSPVLNSQNELIGVFNTADEGHPDICVNDPCEVNERGERSRHIGRRYAQQIIGVKGCFDRNKNFDLTLESCHLPK